MKIGEHRHEKHIKSEMRSSRLSKREKYVNEVNRQIMQRTSDIDKLQLELQRNKRNQVNSVDTKPIYNKPGKIINKDLILNCKDREEGAFLELRQDLMEHHDYEAITQEMWKYMRSWYGYDFAICRYL